MFDKDFFLQSRSPITEYLRLTMNYHLALFFFPFLYQSLSPPETHHMTIATSDLVLNLACVKISGATHLIEKFPPFVAVYSLSSTNLARPKSATLTTFLSPTIQLRAACKNNIHNIILLCMIEKQ